VYYWLAQPRQVVTMDFLDTQGKVIRSFTSQQDPTAATDSIRADSIRTARNDSLRRAGQAPDTTTRSEARGEESTAGDDGPPRRPPPPRVANKAGLNMFAWNLRYPDASVFQNLIMWAGGTAGPIILPGTYTVRMNVNGQSYRQPLTIVKDPRTTATDADLREQFDFLMRIRDKTSQANDAVKTIRNVKAQLADRAKRIPADKPAALMVFQDGASPKDFVPPVFDTLIAKHDMPVTYVTEDTTRSRPKGPRIRLPPRSRAISGTWL